MKGTSNQPQPLQLPMSMFRLFLAKSASDFQKTREIDLIGHPSPYIGCLGSYALSGLEWIYCVGIYIYI